jgi:glycosyltransferase involved in cell wall biosynthesis
MKVQYKLTILILSLPSRIEKFTKLLNHLYRQSVNSSVQIIYLGENKTISVGEKRNQALSLASGRYIAFIDDDDWVSDDYVKEILEATESNPDVITFKVQKYRNGIENKQQRFHEKYGRIYMDPNREFYNMPPNHLCAWRREAIKASFPDKSLREDHIWAEEQLKHIHTAVHLDKVLYHYYYDTNLSETHKR